ncbi:hypothetical protein HY384_03130 [Candidatus Daviesbacteria bacterium]|nr:hypothetical protein [Candidatus Daviesbacteria bacterium]
MGISVQKVLIPIACFILGVGLGVLFNFLPILRFNQPLGTKIEKASTLFKNQLATIEGTVSQVSGQQITIKANNGQSAQFPASKKLTVFKRDPNQPIPQAFEGVNSIEPDNTANFVLELEDGQFRVTSIHYSVTAQPTTSSPSATLKGK